jgi:hypothetical protein
MTSLPASMLPALLELGLLRAVAMRLPQCGKCELVATRVGWRDGTLVCEGHAERRDERLPYASALEEWQRFGREAESNGTWVVMNEGDGPCSDKPE